MLMPFLAPQPRPGTADPHPDGAWPRPPGFAELLALAVSFAPPPAEESVGTGRDPLGDPLVAEDTPPAGLPQPSATASVAELGDSHQPPGPAVHTHPPAVGDAAGVVGGAPVAAADTAPAVAGHSPATNAAPAVAGPSPTTDAAPADAGPSPVADAASADARPSPADGAPEAAAPAPPVPAAATDTGGQPEAVASPAAGAAPDGHGRSTATPSDPAPDEGSVPAPAGRVPAATPAGGAVRAFEPPTGPQPPASPPATSPAAAVPRAVETEPGVEVDPGVHSPRPAAPEHPSLIGRTAAPNTAGSATADPLPPAPGQPAAPTAPTAPTAPEGQTGPETSSSLRRVLEVVERLDHAPPPRRMTVEAGELRLTVSLHGDTVRVAAVGGSASALPTQWARDLAAALTAKGFSLEGFGTDAGGDSGRRQQPHQHDAPATGPDRRPFQATRRTPSGWRL